MAPTTDEDRTSRNRDDIRQWPWQAQFAALLFGLAIAAFLIVLPVLVVRVLDTQYAFSSETDLWAAMIAILLGLTTMTVTGVFVFMTFRIDRGARLAAQRTAEKAMKNYVGDELKDGLKRQFDESRPKINRVYSEVQNDVSRFADDTKKKVSDVADEATRNVSRFADEIKATMSQFADDSVKAVQAQVEQGNQSIQAQVEQGNQSIQKKFDDGMREIEDLFEKVRAAIEGAGEMPDDDGDAGGRNQE